MTELEKLKEYLDNHEYNSVWCMVTKPRDQVVVFDKSHSIRSWDAVCHEYSYGGEKGLLEIYGALCTDVIGWLTADDVIKIIENHKINGGIPIDSMDDIPTNKIKKEG